VVNSGTSFTHYLSTDGANTWSNYTYGLGTTASQIEEWEFQANGELDLFVLNVRYQSTEGPDVDTVYHVRGYSEDMSPDTLTYIGQGDLDSTSGAGNDIRFDFASLGILNDGGRGGGLPRLNRPRSAFRRRVGNARLINRHRQTSGEYLQTGSWPFQNSSQPTA
jgi:hypothetical protein